MIIPSAPSPALTYSTIIPLEAQSVLLGVRNDLTRNYFLVGDLALTLVSQLSATYEAQEVQAAIGYYVGKSARSVRYYQAVCGKIPADMREEFEPYDLSFAHFAHAARFPGREIEILNWAIENNAGVDRLKVEFGKGGKLSNPVPPANLSYRTVPELFQNLGLHLWRRADAIQLNGDKRKRVGELLTELFNIFSGKK